jgi:hypothetical protein
MVVRHTKHRKATASEMRRMCLPCHNLIGAIGFMRTLSHAAYSID